MKKMSFRMAIMMAGLFTPVLAQARDLTGQISSMEGVLEELYEEMMPLCGELIAVSQGIAGFGALWYISTRVWRHIANAEPVDFYPLFRPFVLGFCIMIFPSVLDMINGVMKPTVTATAAMVVGSNQAIAVLLKQKEAAIKGTDMWKMYVGETGYGNRNLWYQYTHEGEDPEEEGFFAGIGNGIRFELSKMGYNFRNAVKAAISEVLNLLFEAAALCINTMRTFQLVVLSILGPFVFGLAVFDGLQHTLTAWLARYINIFLWLPVANIFGSIIGKIQEKMIALDISQIASSGYTTFNSSDLAYMVFLIIGIIGYTTVPSVANYIVHAGGGGGALLQKITGGFSAATSSVTNTVVNQSKKAVQETLTQGRMLRNFFHRGTSGSSGGSSAGGGSDFQKDKLRGN